MDAPADARPAPSPPPDGDPADPGGSRPGGALTEEARALAEREELVARIQLFSGLRPQALHLVAQVAVEERHPQGATIFRHGDVGEKLYVIVEGRVRITREMQGMGEEALAIVGPGEVFGEMALLDDSVRSADARVHERCRLLAIHRDAFEELLFVHKDLAYEVLWNVVRMLTKRLRETNDKFAMLTFAAKF